MKWGHHFGPSGEGHPSTFQDLTSLIWRQTTPTSTTQLDQWGGKLLGAALSERGWHGHAVGQ